MSSEWQITTFDRMAQIIRDTVQPSEANGFPYVGLEHIGEGTLTLSGIGRSVDAISLKSRFKKGDILFGKLRPYFRKIVRAPFDGICSTDIWVVRPKPGVDVGYLFYLMASTAFIEPVVRTSEGTKMPRARWDYASKLEFPIPPLAEQRAIAQILGTLDDKIELNRRMSQILEEIARAVFREMIKDVKEEESILEFAELLSGGTPSTAEEGYWNGDIEWVSAKDVSNADGVFLLDTEKKITQAGIDHSSTKLLPAKTTIVTARGTVGAHCMLGKPMTMNQTNYGLKAKEGIGDYFVYFALSEMIDQLKQQSYGTIFDTITTKTFYSLLCPRPSLDVIQQFEERVAPLMDTILNNQQQSRTLAALRDALLPKLIRGEIRVKDAEKFLQERGL